VARNGSTTCLKFSHVVSQADQKRSDIVWASSLLGKDCGAQNSFVKSPELQSTACMSTMSRYIFSSCDMSFDLVEVEHARRATQKRQLSSVAVNRTSAIGHHRYSGILSGFAKCPIYDIGPMCRNLGVTHDD
jgi:hypothetical protein